MTENITRTPPQIVADAPDRMDAIMRYLGNMLESAGFGVNTYCLDGVEKNEPYSDYALIVTDAEANSFYLEVTEQ